LEATAAARVAYHLGLEGGAEATDCGSASGLAALHRGVSGLRGGGEAGALIAAAHLILSVRSNIGLAAAGLLAPDGRCKVFDACCFLFAPFLLSFRPFCFCFAPGLLSVDFIVTFDQFAGVRLRGRRVSSFLLSFRSLFAFVSLPYCFGLTSTSLLVNLQVVDAQQMGQLLFAFVSLSCCFRFAPLLLSIDFSFTFAGVRPRGGWLQAR
jgi:hypothetical protein